MAKKSAVEKNKRREKMVAKYAAKRAALREKVRDRSLEEEDRWVAALELAALPRNGARTRLRNRCEISGRPRGYYRRFKISRIALRELGSLGKIPGVVKSSW